MISDDSDADADTLDDASLLRALLAEEDDTPVPAAIPDWPPRRGKPITLSLDPDVAQWFQAHHADWRDEIRLVLRAWVAARQEARTV